MTSLLYIPNHTILAAAGHDKQVRLFNMRDNGGELLLSIKGGHTGVINDMCRINEDSIATACSDHSIRIFSLNSQNSDFNRPIKEFKQEKSSPNIVCSLSPTTFLTSGMDRGVRIWDMRLPNPVLFFDSIHYD